MPLEEYQRKRSFDRSPEPRARAGGPRAKALSFVVQKHAARRLHYDLRLEMAGVLKSWAVPKGPSLDPADKRLAVEVEDHPLEYGKFEGTIPEGEYGAGTVIIWDRGSWFPEGDAIALHAKGQLKFRLEGEKLRGRWALVRMTGEHGGKRGENWLFIKEKDSEARPGEGDRILAERPESVAGGGDADPPPLSEVPGAKKGPLPGKPRPQLATLAESPPRGREWIHEIKLDGYRILARLDGGKAQLITRNGKDWTDAFPSVARAVEALPAASALLDGEVVVLDERGVSDFGALQNAIGSSDPRLVYYVFDLLHLDGHDLAGAPLIERKRLLAAVAGKNGTLRYLDHFEGQGADFYGEAGRHGLEGIISKRRDLPYRPGRTRDWLKVKCGHSQELVIGGWTDPEGSRTGLGALLLGLFTAKGRLEFAGKVGTGFSEDLLADLRRRLGKIETRAPPFADAPSGADARGVHWVKPVLVAQVRFAGWTKDGKVRHASYEGLREDKPAREVVRESPVRAAPAAEAPPPARSGRGRGVVIAGVPLTNPERVYYPDRGITKEALIRFYESIAPRLLPHLEDRPVTAVRCPRGIENPCFFQKHANDSVPEVVRRVKVYEGREKGLYLAVDSVEALLTLVQLGALELHTWGSRLGSIEKPDRMIFDLDPGPDVPWEAVVDAAFLIRDSLATVGLATLVKTTGGKGLHVAAPIRPELSWNEVKEASRAIAERIAAHAPARFVATAAKAKRAGKIYIDYLRNARGATSVAPYSTRARPGAPVSTPLAWEELRSVAASSAFTVENLLPRIERERRDPWEPAIEPRQSFPRA
jgi:bifunctional non-homologous end joining protein LigD